MPNVEAQTDSRSVTITIGEREKNFGTWGQFDMLATASAHSPSRADDGSDTRQTTDSGALSSLLSLGNWSGERGTECSNSNRLHALIATAAPAIVLAGHDS